MVFTYRLLESLLPGFATWPAWAQIAVAAVLEQGAWGASAAGPIVRKILDAWLATHDGVIAGATRLPTAAPVAVRPAPVAVGEPQGGAAGPGVEGLPAPASSGDNP